MPTVAGLYYEEHGRSDGPPVLLSSGLGGSAAYWGPNLAALGETYRLILYDQRSTGRSDPALPDPMTVASMADDMLDLLDALGLDRVSLIGHAAGGIAGLALALKAPERLDRILVINGWLSPDPHFARCFDARLALLRDSGVRAYLRAQPIFLYPADWISRNDARLTAEEDMLFQHFPAVTTIEARVAALRAFDIGMAADEITTPVLALVADDDMLVPPSCSRALADALPNARLVAMKGGHACNIVDPDTFNALALDFLGS